MTKTTFHNNHKKMVDQFEKEGKPMTYIINYLFTCDYTVFEIASILINRYHCKRDLVIDTFEADYGFDRILMEMEIEK